MENFKLLKTLLLSLIFVFSFSVVSFAETSFKDISKDHWAYDSIIKMTQKAIMVGDSSGNFNPSSYLDKFETSKNLARAVGYKYIDISDTERKSYDSAYEKNKNLLNSYNNSFSLWNTSSDKEIAYLLEKKILKPEDLAQFIVKDAKGNEKLRAISAEESAVFLVRLIGVEDKAIEGKYTYKFKDNSAIKVENKPYVYYMQKSGVLVGDTSENFNPNSAITRASFAVMLDKSLSLLGGEIPTQTPAPTNNPEKTVIGTFDKYYADLNAVQIIDSQGAKKIYELSTNAKIYVDGKLKTPNDLKIGIHISVVISNSNEILDIKAISIVGTPVFVPTSTPIPINAPIITGIKPIVVTAQPVNVLNPEVANQKLNVEGLISGISSDDKSKILTMDVRMLNTKGEIIIEKRKFSVDAVTKIIRNGIAVDFSSIAIGDVAKIEYSGNIATSVILEEKNRSFVNGLLVDKKYVEETSTPIFVIEDKYKKVYELKVTDTSFISRKGHGQVAWSELRVGDKVDGKAEYDRLVEIYAYGSFLSVKGIVEEIHLNKNQPYIILTNKENNKKEKYYLISSSIDIYAFRIGDYVELRLDSKEVASFVTAPAHNDKSFTGYIQRLGPNNIIKVKSSTSNFAKEQEIQINFNTTMINYVSGGNKINFSQLYSGMKIYVTFQNDSSNVAKSVNVISE